jgi:hypothetical protein
MYDFVTKSTYINEATYIEEKQTNESSHIMIPYALPC